jgi:hypothetical protein
MWHGLAREHATPFNEGTMSNTPRLAIPVNESDHPIGPASAAVTVINYGDYQCPDCHRRHREIQKAVVELSSTVRFIYRHFRSLKFTRTLYVPLKQSRRLRPRASFGKCIAYSFQAHLLFTNVILVPNFRPTPFEKPPKPSLARLFWKSRGLK